MAGAQNVGELLYEKFGIDLEGPASRARLEAQSISSQIPNRGVASLRLRSRPTNVLRRRIRFVHAALWWTGKASDQRKPKYHQHDDSENADHDADESSVC